jgi:hypothetical protein
MERIIERVCGLDVHQASVAACLRVTGANRSREQFVKLSGLALPICSRCEIGWQNMG